MRTLSALRGNPVLLNFISVDDEGCRRTLIALNEHAASWQQRGPQLLAINLGEEGNLRAFLRDHRFSFPLLQGTDDVAAVYNIVYRYIFDRHRDLTLPMSFLIDAKGAGRKL